MSRRGWAVVVGAGAAGAAVALGSRPLAVAGIGFLLAAALSRAWAGLARAPVRVDATFAPRPATEGDEIRLSVDVHGLPRVPAGAVTFAGSLAGMSIERRLRRRGSSAACVLELGPVPRGRYAVTEARVELADPIGLGGVSLPVEARALLLVRPRVIELGPLFSERGRASEGGRRLPRRAVGFDLRSVREHEQGEPLRRVHWPTTARRGQLMVKDLEDAPREAVAVLLGCDRVARAPSFDLAVRAVASLVHALSTRGRRVVLVGGGGERHVVRVGAGRVGLERALDALAAIQPDAGLSLAEALRDSRRLAPEAGELIVVTCALSEHGALALLRAAERQAVSVVCVDPPGSFGERQIILRLRGAGIPLAIVRIGDDLASALGRPRAKEVESA
ncbi:MAG: DUF58 domain-containing protein [Gaiellaceae bacterium]|nr:DUF58 domain-containing protein [Gaiellaceae bacterium]